MRCTDCGIERWKLHRHHILPKSQGGGDGDNLVAICANCHEDRHGGPNTDTLPWQLGHTPEATAKRSASMLKLWADPEYRTRQHASRVAAQTPENRARKRVSILRFWDENPEQRAKHGAVVSLGRRRQLAKDKPP